MASEKELKRIEKEEKKSLKLQKKEMKQAYKKEKSIFDEEEKERKRNEPLSERELQIRALNEAPKRSVLEEIGNSVSHGVGCLFGLIALVLMLLRSDTPIKIVASLVYGISISLMMLMSCLYHSWKHGLRVKRIWRRFDYCSIYLLIGGTFAPLQLIELGQNEGHPILALIWFIIMWVLIVTGITFVSIFGPGRTKKLNFPLYFIIGWSGLMFLPGWIKFNLPLLFWILGGGIVYSLGMIPFVLKKKSAHFIFHLLVLVGCVLHFVGIYTLVYMV